ncbi:hypothetical protein [Serratia fonticola]|jgi:hypothetical protein|uniref:hypothetical protein n=1 Tax=Serratia fonticola TaxID=47917 RepID=UPI001415365D|nr:hypothetical protein [Serratia fonticola]QIP93989.1 Acetyltransferase [Serratia fonticola]
MPNPSVLKPSTLIGNQIELRPLQPEHREAMLSAAADGELWNLKVTAVPSAQCQYDRQLYRHCRGGP